MSFGGIAICKELFEYLRQNLKTGSTILELGTGDGTKELVKFYEVISIEFDPKFINYESRAVYINAPIRRYDHNGVKYQWFDRDIIKNYFAGLVLPYDCIIVDSPTGVIGRSGFWYNKELFNLDVMIIIDDVNRDEEFTILKHLTRHLRRKVEIFSSTHTQFAVIHPKK